MIREQYLQMYFFQFGFFLSILGHKSKKRLKISRSLQRKAVKRADAVKRGIDVPTLT